MCEQSMFLCLRMCILGGKSYAMLADPMRDFTNPNFRGLLLRRTSPELRELIQESKKLYPRLFPGAKFMERNQEWVFPSGATHWMSYLDRDDDVYRYQGQAFTWIGFDELTHWPTPMAWDYLRSRLRSSDPTISLSMRFSTNPGGVGAWWVKKMFIDPAPMGQAFNARDVDNNELVWPDTEANRVRNRVGQPLFQRRFIPSKLSDNPYLYEDGQYEASLLSLPEHKRRQLLDGDWDTMDGSAFSEFSRSKHVIAPFEIPEGWMRFRSCDFGYSSWSAVHWYAVDPVYSTIYVYRELYVSKYTAKDLAKAVLELEQNETISYGVLDSSCWHQRGTTGPTIAEEMMALGCFWMPSDRTKGARINGKNRLHELLKYDDESDRSSIQFFDNCTGVIAHIPALVPDPRNPEDIDTRSSIDHTYDSIRYGIMTRPEIRGHNAYDDFSRGTANTGYKYKYSEEFGY